MSQSSIGRRATLVAVLAASSLLGCRGESTVARKPPPPAPPIAHTVDLQQVDDLKAVIATVRSKKVVDARVRTPGTVVSLRVAEGDHVEAGQILGLVADPKIALRLRASEAQIAGLESRTATAKAELDRVADLQKKGIAPQSRLDQAKTAHDLATNELVAARSERSVIEKQAEEGQILAPSSGRVLRVPVTVGSVVLAGESIATVAANEYLLRIEVPERHARSLHKGDAIKVGERGLGTDQQAILEGRIVQVYPEVQAGRVVADAEVDGLGDYFVGERILAWISGGKRSAIVVPRQLIFKRFGLDYARIAAGDGTTTEVVVQLGQTQPPDAARQTVEVLAGLRPGDKLVQP